MIAEHVVDLSRFQFAATALYHFLFVPLTLGMAFLLAIMESVYVMTNNTVYRDMTKFWGKLFGINFALGVTTGLTMEFQFGTNWAYYSHYVGDIFGAPLAIEGLMAFFLENLAAPGHEESLNVRAVQAAVMMQRGVAYVSSQLLAEGREALQVGIGLHYGEAVVGFVGNANRLDYTALGHTVVVSQRLQSIAGGGEVSDADWASFLATEVTPRFPDGLSVVDAAGQWRGPSGEIARERSKLLVVIVFDAPAHGPRVQAVIDAYLKRFRQQEVLRTERPVCAG